MNSDWCGFLIHYDWCLCIRRGETQRRESYVKTQILTEGWSHVVMEADTDVMICKLRNAKDWGHGQKPGRGKKMIFLCRFLRKHGATTTWFWMSSLQECETIYFLFYLDTQLMILCNSSPRKVQETCTSYLHLTSISSVKQLDGSWRMQWLSRSGSNLNYCWLIRWALPEENQQASSK